MKTGSKIDFTFLSTKRGSWLNQISQLKDMSHSITHDDHITIHLSKDINKECLGPIHLVTLACIIQLFKDKEATVALSRDNPPVSKYIYDELGFKHYWTDGCNHVDSLATDNIFNLWRIVESEKELYAKNVESYLKRHFFSGKDLSSINVSLIEAFYNVFDHAQANGNAFSLIKFDSSSQILHVAISDFGIGIRNSIKQKFPEKFLESDSEAIRLSISDSFTIKSTNHNKGLGFSNIISNVDTIRIFSNTGLYVKKNNSHRFLTTTFSFPGTLIYFEVDLSKLDNEEILDIFNW